MKPTKQNTDLVMMEVEFELRGGESWTRKDIYPRDKVHTREFVEWLVKRIIELEKEKQ